MSKTNWDLKSGDIVAMNDLPDAALYVVTQVKGVEIGVQQLIPRMRFPQDSVATEWADISSCRVPSIKRLSEALRESLA